MTSLDKEDELNNAFVLRISPSGGDRVPEALETSELIIGWSRAQDLLDTELNWQEFRQIVHDEYYSGSDSYSSSGKAAGNLWRFIREMNSGDYVMVPGGDQFRGEFFVARVTGKARYDEEKIDEDMAYRRPVEWLNEGKSMSRSHARAALKQRLKVRGTCVRATDLIAEIERIIEGADRGERPSFEEDLRLRLVAQALEEIRSGNMNDYGFELLVATVLRSLGATTTRVLSRSKEDKGADIVADFLLATAFDFVLAVQVKHYRPDPPIGEEVVQQLVSGMEAEGTNLGMVVTSGRFSEEASLARSRAEEKQGFRIELVDGEQLAAMIVEGGLRQVYG